MAAISNSVEVCASADQAHAKEWSRVFNLLRDRALENGYLPFGGCVRDEISGSPPKDLDVLHTNKYEGMSLDILTRTASYKFQIAGYKLNIFHVKGCSGYTKIDGPLTVYRLILEYVPISSQQTEDEKKDDKKDDRKVIEIGFDLVREEDLTNHLHDFDVNCLVRQKDGTLRLKHGLDLDLEEVIENCEKKRFRILNGPVAIPSNEKIVEMWTKLYHGHLPSFIEGIISSKSKFQFGLTLPYLHMRLLYAHRLARMLNAGWSPVIDGKEIDVTYVTAVIQAIDQAGLVARCGDVTKEDSKKDDGKKDQEKEEEKEEDDTRPLLVPRQDDTCGICQKPLLDAYCMRTMCCAHDVHSGCLLTKLSNAHNHAKNEYFDEYWATRKKYYHLNPILCPICQKGDKGCTNCRGACDPYGWTPVSYRCISCLE